jgi:hypothetical protein
VRNLTIDRFTLARPAVSTRIDRLIVSLRPFGSTTNPGHAVFGILAGEEGGAAPDLTQSANLYQISLATITVPKAGALTLTDTRAFVGEKLSDQAEDRVSEVTTTSAVGAALTGLSVTLDIPRSGTYDITASLSAQQVRTVASNGWELQATYGPTFNSLAMGSPGQVAVDSTGRILVADPGSDRLVILTSAGAYSASITGLTDIIGVCVDSLNNIYVTYEGVLQTCRKYSSGLALQWTSAAFGGSIAGHIATDDTHLFITDRANHVIYKRLCATGAAVATYGGPGSSNGDFSSPWGIAVDGGADEVFIVDAGNTRVQVLSRGGVYIRKWTISTGGRGCALNPGLTHCFVALLDTDLVLRYEKNVGTLVDSFPQANPSGVDVASGDVVWVSNAGDGTIAKWDIVAYPGGYGEIAIEIDGVVSDYVGIGNREGAVANAATGTKEGGSTVLVRAFGKRTSQTLTLNSAMLSARAVPRR